MIAFWRRKVDLPAMLGPVSNQTLPSPVVGKIAIIGNERHAFGLQGLACSTTGCRPPETEKAPLSSTCGAHQFWSLARQARAQATSSSASALGSKRETVCT